MSATCAASVDLAVHDFPAAHRSLRVACVTETYPPEVNGVATTLARLVEGLRAHDHEVQLVRPRQDRHDAGSGDEILVPGMPIPAYPHLKLGLPAKRRLLALWMRWRPDLVHIATEGPLGWSALQAAHKLNLPVSSDFRTHFDAYSKHYGVGWLDKPILMYLRKFHNLAHCTMVPTEALRLALASCGFHNLLVVARGVDTALFDPLRRRAELRRAWGAAPEDLVLVQVGRLAHEKNLELLAATWDAVRNANARARLVIVGDGPAREWLRARCPTAHFAGMRTGADLAEHYASGDLFLFPSLTETYGNVVPEAMASGVPVLAYDYAAAAQLVRSRHSGVLVPLDDSAAFIATARDLAAHPGLLSAMGQAAREAVMRVSWRQVVEQVEAIFRATARRAPAPSAPPLLRAQTSLRW
jgi:glycosyltransferase involved in cell wall biosynthesis